MKQIVVWKRKIQVSEADATWDEAEAQQERTTTGTHTRTHTPFGLAIKAADEREYARLVAAPARTKAGFLDVGANADAVRLAAKSTPDNMMLTTVFIRYSASKSRDLWGGESFSVLWMVVEGVVVGAAAASQPASDWILSSSSLSLPSSWPVCEEDRRSGSRDRAVSVRMEMISRIVVVQFCYP